MEIQIALGADIIMAFDECTEHPADRDRARESMDLTLRWANGRKTTSTTHKSEVPWANNQRPTTNDQNLFGIVQGGMYPDLRRECAERLVEMDFPGYAVGGLSVGEPRDLTYEVVNATLPHLPENKPRYLMGVGTPEEIVEYVAQGIDMMDCVLPTRAARHGLLFTSRAKSISRVRAMPSMKGPSIQIADAKSVRGTLAPTFGTSMQPTKCWPKC